MEFKLNNLYQNGTILEFENGEQLLERDPVKLEGTLTDSYCLFKKDWTLDFLAWTYYKDVVSDASKFWWIIADANLIVNPLDLDYLEGTEILIPNITKALLILDK